MGPRSDERGNVFSRCSYAAGGEVALTNGVNLTWLSEQTGVMESTLRTHYGRFIHASQAAALELAEIDPMDGKKEKFAPRRSKLEEKSFELQEKDGGWRSQIRGALCHLSTCQPVDTHTVVDKRRLTQGG